MELLAQSATGGADVAEIVLFATFGALALGAGIAMVVMRNIVHAALMLVLNFLSIAALYLTLQSSFLSIIQVIVYAGAIMVLFLFVIMLLGVDRDDLLFDVKRWHLVGALLGSALVAATLLFGVVGTYTGPESRCGTQAPTDVVATAGTQPCVGLEDAVEGNDAGAVGVLADRMFGRYTFPFELAAVLLTVATIGAMLLGRREQVTQADDPAWVPSIAPPDDVDAEMAMASLESASIAAGDREPRPLEASRDRDLVTDDPEVVEAQRERVVPDEDADEPGEDA
jgi:NADH-quinone oxidoreductase subunit J